MERSIWRKILALFTALIILIACSPSKSTQQSDNISSIQRQKDTLTINGDDADWLKPLVFQDEPLGLQ